MNLGEIIDGGIQNFAVNFFPHGDMVIGNFNEILSEDSEDEYGGKTLEEACKVARQLKTSQKRALCKYGLQKIMKDVYEKMSANDELKHKELKQEEDVDLESVYCDLGQLQIQDNGGTSTSSVRSKVEEVVAKHALQKSALKPGLEKQEALPPLQVSLRRAAEEGRKKREATRGKGWFDMAAGELTEETKNDLELLRMRSALDPKHFYKKNDMKNTPKYFQMGTVEETAADFYSSRIPKKQRKQTMVEELLADAEFRQYNKRRYAQIVEERRKSSFRAHRHAARLKRKGKSKN